METLAARLVNQKGLVPLERLDWPEARAFDTSPFSFVGSRSYWRSIISVAIHDADHIDSASALHILDCFFSFTSSLRRYAGSVGLVRLGSFGLLIHTFHGGCSQQLRDTIVAQRRGNSWAQNYCLSWVVDYTVGQAYRHQGLPLFMFPGDKWVSSTIRR